MIQDLAHTLHGRRLRSALQANPAAGAEIIITVPAYATWEIVALECYFLAGAGGGNRRFDMQVTVGAIPTMIGVIHDTVAATTGNLFKWVAGAGDYFDFAAVLETYQQIPQGLILGPGTNCGTLTANLQALDQYSAVNFTYIETLTP